MPELPEVEVVRLGLIGPLEGSRITGVIVREARLRWPVPQQLPDWARGQVIERLARRGKYLLMIAQDGVLISHLGMSGNWRWIPESLYGTVPLRKHDHVDICFEQGVLRYHDPRRFGALLWHPHSDGPWQQHALLRGLGIEPLEGEWNGDLLFRSTRGRKAAVKQMLLAGEIVVGVGNIYCSEALFRAGIRPTLAAGRISRKRYHLLATAIRQILSEAVKQGGSTLRDFAGSDGDSGYFQISHQVYDRAGQPCRRCQTPVRGIRQGQRSSFYCPSCQK